MLLCVCWVIFFSFDSFDHMTGSTWRPREVLEITFLPRFCTRSVVLCYIKSNHFDTLIDTCSYRIIISLFLLSGRWRVHNALSKTSEVPVCTFHGSRRSVWFNLPVCLQYKACRKPRSYANYRLDSTFRINIFGRRMSHCIQYKYGI